MVVTDIEILTVTYEFEPVNISVPSDWNDFHFVRAMSTATDLSLCFAVAQLGLALINADAPEILGRQLPRATSHLRAFALHNAGKTVPGRESGSTLDFLEGRPSSVDWLRLGIGFGRVERGSLLVDVLAFSALSGLVVMYLNQFYKWQIHKHQVSMMKLQEKTLLTDLEIKNWVLNKIQEEREIQLSQRVAERVIDSALDSRPPTVPGPDRDSELSSLVAKANEDFVGNLVKYGLGSKD